MAGDQGLIWIAVGLLIVYTLTLTLLLLEVRESLRNIQGDFEGRFEDIEKMIAEDSKSSKDLKKRIERVERDLEEFSHGLRNLQREVEELSKSVKEISEEMEKQREDSEARLGDLREEFIRWKTQSEGEMRKIWTVINQKEETLRRSFDEKLGGLKKYVDAVARAVAEKVENPLLKPVVEIVVRRGDTLIEISKAYGISVEEIMKLNGISDPRRLMAGFKLKLPLSLKDRLRLPVERIERGSLAGGMDESGWMRFRGAPLSAMPGRVDEVRDGYVRMYHGNGIETSYRFFGKVLVDEGDWIREGARIADAEEFDFALLFEGEPRDIFRYAFERIGKFELTFYTEWEDGILPEQASFRVTKSGKIVEDWWTMAADPSVLPLGTLVYIPSLSRKPGGGLFRVEDVGGAIKGRKLDLYIGDVLEALRLWKMEVIAYGMREGRGE